MTDSVANAIKTLIESLDYQVSVEICSKVESCIVIAKSPTHYYKVEGSGYYQCMVALAQQVGIELEE